MYLVYIFPYLFWLQLLEARKIVPKPSYGDSRCDDGMLEGDCNIGQCLSSKLGNACEARFVRYSHNGKEFSRKTCRCLSEPICSLVEFGQVGCVTYKNLSHKHQKSIRRWTMTASERQSNTNLYGNEYKSATPSNISIYSSQLRHQQLLNGSTRFCCRMSNVNKQFLFHANKPIASRRNNSSRNTSLAFFTLLLLIVYIS